MVLILTKSDKRAPSDLPQIKSQVLASVEKILGRAPICTIMVSSRRQAAELRTEVSKALALLEQQSEQAFQFHVGNKSLSLLQTTKQQVSILANQDDLNSEQLAAKKEDLQQQMALFQKQLEQQTTNMEQDVSTITANICRHVQSSLLSQRDSFASTLLSGGDLGPALTQTVRLSATEAIQKEFVPRIQRYIQSIEAELPVDIKVADLQLDTNDENGFNLSSIGIALLPMLGKVLPNLLKFLGPYGLAASAILTTVASLFLNQHRKDEAKQQRLEEAKNLVSSKVIPDAVSEVNKYLPPFLQAQIETTKEKIQSSSQERFNELQHSLTTLEQQLHRSQAEYQQQQAVYLNDLQQIDNLITTLQA